MQREFEARFTGWSFILAGLLLGGGWMLLPRQLGTYFVPEDFSLVHDQFLLWIWIYRVHIFGMVISAIALFAVATSLAENPCRILVWPGVGVAAAGTFVSALGAAFYYHHGAWGALELEGKSAEEIQAFVDNLRVDTEYVTCLIRFGRVFTGLGLVLLGLGFVRWKVLPAWVGGGAVLLGLAAMALTMGLPDRLSLFEPVFYLQVLWMVATGVAVLRAPLQ